MLDAFCKVKVSATGVIEYVPVSLAAMQGSGVVLPVTPATALLDAASPNQIVFLNGTGVGGSMSYAATRAAIGAGTSNLALGSTTGTAYDGALGTTATSNATTALANAATAQSAANAAQSTANAALPSANAATALGLYSEYSLAASPGAWTLNNGSGTATITGGKARLSLNTGIIPGAYANQVKIYTPSIQNTWSVDLRARMASLSGGNNGAVYASFGVRSGTGGQGVFANIRLDGGVVAVSCYTDTISGGGSKGDSNAVTRANMTSGNLWMRFAINGASIVLFYGIGVAGAMPTEWDVVGSTTSTASWKASYMNTIIMALDAVSPGSPDAVTIEWDSITTRGAIF